MRHLAIFIFLISALFTGCSQHGNTKASFQVTVAGLSSLNVGGGFVITGKNLQGDAFSRVLTTGDDISVQVPNGTWNFLAVAWDGGGPLQGEIRCAYQKNVSLAGGDTSISFSLTNLKCFDGTVNATSGDGGTPNQFLPANWQNCRTSISSLGIADVCDFNMTDAQPKGAIIGSLRAGIAGGTKSGAGTFVADNTLLTPGCVAAPDYYSVSPVFFPAVKSDFFFPVVMDNYLAPDCNGGPSVRAVYGSTMKALDNGAETLFFSQFSDATICAAGSSATTLDQIGANYPGAPYGICTLAQLKDFQENYVGNAYDTANVALLVDLDLITYAKLENNASPYSDCLDRGDTFIPIGMSVDGSCLFTLETDFTGRFHGLEHSISHFRTSIHEDSIGFFARVMDGGGMSHVKFIRPHVRGENQVGAALGFTNLPVTNIKVIDGFVEGNDEVGGVIGHTDSGVPSTALSASGTVRAGGTASVGGLIGFSIDGLEDSSFDGDVIAPSAQGVGGLVGDVTHVYRSWHSGRVVGDNQVGGIAGIADTIDTCRSMGAITAQGTPDDLGGIVGYSGAGIVTNSLFGGRVHSKCTSSCNYGTIAGDALTTNINNASENIQVNSATAGTINPTIFRCDDAALSSTAFCDGSLDWADATASSGDLPRVKDLEPTHLCNLAANHASVTAQIAASRGASAATPISLCDMGQLAEVVTNPTKHYKMLQDIALTDTYSSVVDSSASNGLTGSFNGNKRLLIAHDVDMATNSSLFYKIGATGSLKDLRIALAHFADTGFAAQVATIAIQNDGLISGVQVQDSSALSGSNVGGLVVYNNATGTIQKSMFDGDVAAHAQVGGLVAQNVGTLSDVLSRAKLRPNIPSPANSGGTDLNFGGVAGTNSGTIQRALFQGSIGFENTATWDATNIGGIAGLNTGTVTNSEFGRDGRIRFTDDALQVGGLVGYNNNGALTKVVSNGLVAADDGWSYAVDKVGAVYAKYAGTPPSAVSSTHAVQAEYQANGQTVSMGSFVYTTNQCEITTSISIAANPEVLAAPSFRGRIYIMNWDGSSLMTVDATDQEHCPAPDLYDLYLQAPAVPSASPLSYVSLAGAGFTIFDTTVASTNRTSALNAYKQFIQGIEPTSAPVWKYEDGDAELLRFDND